MTWEYLHFTTGPRIELRRVVFTPTMDIRWRRMGIRGRDWRRHESNYDLTMARQSPLDAAHKSLGAKLVDFGGWNMPLNYPSGTTAEHHACRTSAVAFDVSHLGTMRMDGDDVVERVQRALTNDLNKITPGRAQYSHLLDDEGSVVDDIIVWWVSPTRLDVMPNASNTTRVVNALGGTDVTSSRAIIAVQGPEARERVRKVHSDLAEVPHFGVQQITWRDADVVVAGTGYTGEDGIELAVPTEVAETMWQELLDAGVVPAGLGARDTLRLEAGLPLHGHELGPGITPLQAGLNWVVSWDKGPFIGREALLAERERGISRRLRGFVAEGRRPLREGCGVIIDGAQVGTLTSGNISQVLGHGIGMGFVPPEVKPGAQLQIDVRGTLMNAEVVKPPFVNTNRHNKTPE